MHNEDYKEVEFLGKITASITHEMQNVFAIINESTGLMEDMLNLSEDIPTSSRDKFQNIIVTIQNQIQRGIEIALQLNRFAHAPEEVEREIDLQDIIEHFVVLAQRFVKLQKVSLKCGLTDRTHRIMARPVPLLMAIFAGLECFLPNVPEGGEIVCHSVEKKGRYAIHLVCEGMQTLKNDPNTDIHKCEAWRSLEEIVTNMGGAVHGDEQSRGIFIGFPKMN